MTSELDSTDNTAYGQFLIMQAMVVDNRQYSDEKTKK